ncbi:MAG: ROK family protein [Anaerolineaceae bacterium]|nr:ROK family protein [Anaerolineaceae bacterium]
MKSEIILGIDIGGSSIKAAPIDVSNAEIVEPFQIVNLPEKPGPDDVRDAIMKAMELFNWKDGKIGCTFPGVIQNKTILTTANVDVRWQGVNLESFIEEFSGCQCAALNDADAAGVAEMAFGVGQAYKEQGIVLLLTLGTGIGSAVFVNGNLLKNTEFGHMEVMGMDAETYASAAVKTRENLSYEAWAGRLQTILEAYEGLIYPDLIILGGGISKDIIEYEHFLHVKAKIIPAKYQNQAGLVGAALYAGEQIK